MKLVIYGAETVVATRGLAAATRNTRSGTSGRFRSLHPIA